MDFLNFLKEKKLELSEGIHPYANSSHSFKYIYCFGLGVLSLGNMKAVNETKKAFEEVLNLIKLDLADQNRIISDINNNFDYKVNEVFENIDTKEKQYTFCCDLYKISENTLWGQSYCEAVIDCYMSVFGFSQEERKYFIDFTEATKKNQIENCKKIYQQFEKDGFHISYRLLQYMCGKFMLEDIYDRIDLNDGSLLILDKPTMIRGDVIISNGSSLCLDGADINITGSVRIDGGRIYVKNSQITVKGCVNPYLFQISNSAKVTIENSRIDCNLCCSAVYQDSGYLLIKASHLKNTIGSRSLYFSGRELILRETVFENCMNGAVIVSGETLVYMEECDFTNCKEEHGGAIYLDSLYDTRISNCRFHNCHAKYIGGAVYFRNKKYEQRVTNCQLTQCSPADSLIFNAYPDLVPGGLGEPYETR